MIALQWRVRLGAVAEVDFANILKFASSWTRDLFRFQVLQPNPSSCAQAAPRLFDTTQEAGVLFETIFEPVLLGLKADQYARRFAMAGDNDLFFLRLAKIARQIVLDFGERNFPHSGFPNCASHDQASDFATI